MIYQQINLASGAPLGTPGVLPKAIFGWPTELVADVSSLDPAYGLTGTGFWPVIEDIPAHDATIYSATPGALTVHSETKTVSRAWDVFVDPAKVPRSISRRQFYAALWKDNRITFEEADAALTGTIPVAIEGFLELLASYDEVGAKDARLLLKGATTFERDNYVVPVFGSMYGMTNEQIDDLWRLGFTL